MVVDETTCQKNFLPLNQLYQDSLKNPQKWCKLQFSGAWRMGKRLFKVLKASSMGSLSEKSMFEDELVKMKSTLVFLY
jgi:hypothetical protein